MAIRRRSHVDRVNAYILVWPGDERQQVSFDGEVFYVPAIDETAQPSVKGSPYKFESARDRAGELIPGTVIVADRHGIVDGVRQKVFDADMFVMWVETVRQDLGAQGMMIVDFPEEVAEAKMEGRPVFEKSQDAKARQVLEVELFRRQKWESKGTPAPPSSSEHIVAWAIKHLRERGVALSLIKTEDIVSALSGGQVPTTEVMRALQPVGAPPVAAPRPPRAAAAMDGSEIFVRAKGLGVKLLKDDLENLLTGDPETIKAVQAEIAKKELELQEQEAEPAKA